VPKVEQLENVLTMNVEKAANAKGKKFQQLFEKVTVETTVLEKALKKLQP